MNLIRTLHAGAWAACLAGSACSTAAPAPPADADTLLQQLVGDAACSTDAQCHTLGWGAKACGGPARWVAWSSTRSDAQALQALADQHAATQREEQQRRALVSTCSVVPDPGARCVAQRCQLNGVAAPVVR